MVNKDDIKQYILENVPDARPASGGKEIVCRCRLCGDSRDPKSKHFYIGFANDSVILYNCFKCGSSGVFTPKMLRMFDLYDSTEIAIELDRYNKEMMKLPKNRIYSDTAIHRLNNNFISDNDLSLAKLRYINNRLGTNLTYQDILNMKIVLNLKDLLRSNYINSYTRHENIVDELDTSFIGFISYDNSFINMRNLRSGKVHKSVDTRYVNYNIFGKVDNSKRYYIIPTNINLLDPNPIKIRIAEGPFDILSIYHNMVEDKYNNVFASIGGKAYLNIIKFFIQELGLINIELHIYPDADIDDWSMYNIRNYLDPFNIDIFVHRNTYPGEKDFGVSKDKIKESITQIAYRR